MRRALVIVGLIGVSIGVVPRTQAATVVKIDCSSSPGLLIDTAGKFVVKKDVTNCASTDLVLISASDVTLDLNDKTLDGVDGSCANGVGVTGAFSNVTVTNGTIRDCNDGVDLVVATNSKVKELTIKSTAGPGIVLGSGNQAIANTIRNAGSNAISGTSGTVKRNKIITPVLAGVAIVSGLVERNVIETPGTNGVSLTGGGIANFNEISNSGAAGISSAGGGEVSDNVISDAQDNGIELVSGVAERNVIKRSLQNGILGGGGVFSDNVIKRSGDNGILSAMPPS